MLAEGTMFLFARGAKFVSSPVPHDSHRAGGDVLFKTAHRIHFSLITEIKREVVGTRVSLIWSHRCLHAEKQYLFSVIDYSVHTLTSVPGSNIFLSHTTYSEQ